MNYYLLKACTYLDGNKMGELEMYLKSKSGLKKARKIIKEYRNGFKNLTDSLVAKEIGEFPIPTDRIEFATIKKVSKNNEQEYTNLEDITINNEHRIK